MKRRLLTLSACLLGACAALTAQTTTSVGEGVLWPTQNSARVNGVKVQVTPDGAVWFLESSADIIARLKDGVIRQWQIRPSTQLGATPVDFELDGDVVWFIESGQSQIPAGTSAYAKLDTTTNELTEWVIPGTIPAAFYRAPDGMTVWLPQSGAVLQALRCSLPDPTPVASCPTGSLQVINYRSPRTYAYADMVLDGDGAFWLVDFGDNRIVKWVPGAETETSWTFYPLSGGRLNPAQIQLDQSGSLWITQRSANRVDRFDPATGNLYSYANIAAPIHLDIFQGQIYVTSIASTSTVSVLDPNQAVVSGVETIVPETLTVGSTVSTRAVTVRNTTLPASQVTDFTSAPATVSATEFTYTNPGTTPGLLKITFPSSNSYGLTVVGGRLWIGTDGKLAALNLQGVGIATDQAVPMATSLAGSADSKVRIDVTVSNRGTASLSGQAFYLYSPASPTPRATFTLAASATSLIADMFGNLAGPSTLLNGPVRLGTTSGSPADLSATVRSLRVLPDGGTFGYLFPALSATTSLVKDSTTTLFTGASSSDVSILNLFSLVDSKATLTLYAPDGTVRGQRDFVVAKNASFSFNPVASAFGPAADVPPEPGDAVRVAVTDGTLQTSVLVFSAGTTDVLPSLPAAATTASVLPWVGSFANGDRSFVSDLSLSNPSADTSATVTLTFYGIGAAPSTPATLTLAPLQTQAIADVLSTLFGVSAGQGAIVLSSTSPVAASVRVATHVAAGDYGTFANALDAAAGLTAGESAFAIGLPQTATRTGLLLLYNAGAAGAVSVAGFRADGAPAGTLTVSLGDHAAAVVGPVFAGLGVSNQAAGRVRVGVSDGMNVFGWAAAVDSVTGDIDLTPLQ
jgi:streptogramin lyase